MACREMHQAMATITWRGTLMSLQCCFQCKALYLEPRYLLPPRSLSPVRSYCLWEGTAYRHSLTNMLCFLLGLSLIEFQRNNSIFTSLILRSSLTLSFQMRAMWSGYWRRRANLEKNKQLSSSIVRHQGMSTSKPAPFFHRYTAMWYLQYDTRPGIFTVHPPEWVGFFSE